MKHSRKERTSSWNKQVADSLPEKVQDLRLKKYIYYSALVNIIHIVDLTKRKLKVPLLKQTEKKLFSNKVRVHRKSPYLGLTPLVIGEFLYQGEDSRVHIETTLGVFILYFSSFFWVYREKTPVEQKHIKHFNWSVIKKIKKDYKKQYTHYRSKVYYFDCFERSLLCSTRLHLFDPNYSKNSIIVKYFYNLK